MPERAESARDIDHLTWIAERCTAMWETATVLLKRVEPYVDEAIIKQNPTTPPVRWAAADLIEAICNFIPLAQAVARSANRRNTPIGTMNSRMRSSIIPKYEHIKELDAAMADAVAKMRAGEDPRNKVIPADWPPEPPGRRAAGKYPHRDQPHLERGWQPS